MRILRNLFRFTSSGLLVLLLATGASASNNIPLDSPLYAQIEKLASFGLIRSDFYSLRPWTWQEAARLLAEAEEEAAKEDVELPHFAEALLDDVGRTLKRESVLRAGEGEGLVWSPLSSLRYRYIQLEGEPREYRRWLFDRGNEGVFGIGSGLRPRTPATERALQQGREGTPLLENNEGVVYRPGSNNDLKLTAEAAYGAGFSFLAEPQMVARPDRTLLRLNKGYVKIGGEGLELEVGRDENWIGPGDRGAITLTNNARNLDLVKLSSPEPLDLPVVGLFKYGLIFSRLDRVETAEGPRQPWFFAMKLAFKPHSLVDFGINIGRQVGGPGVDNSFISTVQGMVGGTNRDNSNSLAGFDMRVRMAWLRNTEIYGELSGEDAASFWPIMESYVAGIRIPRLTEDGRTELQVEYFWGHPALYTNSTFPEGYLYYGMPLGHSQGGATQDISVRLTRWLSPVSRLTAEYLRTERGNIGKVTVDGQPQALEHKDAVRIGWHFPLVDAIDLNLGYGYEKIWNLNLAPGASRENHLVKVEVTWNRR